MSLTAEELSYFLPEAENYDPAIPKPQEILGFEVGDWHPSHDQLVSYMQAIEKASPRIKLEITGRTHEMRPLLLLTISSEKNINSLDNIREKHRMLRNPSASDTLNLKNMPVVTWLSFSIHGNEQSGSNAAILLAYHLAASKSAETDSLLNNTIILIDPCMNPDGMQRYSAWVNMHKGKHLIAHNEHREHWEPWPNGRTNHYWFDLNRDWLVAAHPESKSRLQHFHKWSPNIFTDHHEMEADNTFFFQPGIPSRNNPLTPAKTHELCEKIAAYHARAMEKNKRLFYAKESFDDFYYGKSSTYPDINASIGILFEQASTRGHLRETVHGDMSFAFTIKNQLTVALSSLEASNKLRLELLSHMKNFWKEALELAEKDNYKAYIFGSEIDAYKAHHLAEVLMRHDITLYRSLRDLKIAEKNFKSESSYIIPLNQVQYRLIRAFFDRQTSFTDSLFYDISAWAFDLAYNLDFEKLNARNIPSDLIGLVVDTIKHTAGVLEWKSNYAYAIRWEDYKAPAALYQLQKMGVKVKMATKNFSDNRGNTFTQGTLLIPLGIQTLSADDIYIQLNQLAESHKIAVYPMETGGELSAGVLLGSPSFLNLKKPEIGLICGPGINPLEAGEIWHLLDHTFDIPVTLLSTDLLSRADLRNFNTLLLPDGAYGNIDGDFAAKMKTWVQNGGLIIAQKRALQWLASLGLSDAAFKNLPSVSENPVPYRNFSALSGSQVIGGAIFKITLDLSHPLAYGYRKNEINIFRNHRLFLEKSNNPLTNPFQYTAEPLVSGYISKQNLDLLKNTYATSVSSYGSGKIIGFTDNHNFRAFWLGTHRLYLNALFIGSEIRTR
ncbi:MAG: zinc carboxypeptidase [Cyclobacteriaceae bacterium]|nr:zinc carboxypeptidase [Cyclobacteriaceae bacterium]